MTDEGWNVEDCLRRLRAGDADAAQGLVEQLYPLVIRIVRGHRPTRQSEEDAAQEIFLKLFARLGRYTPRADVPFAHWVARLSVRTCRDILRAERRRPELRWSDLTAEQRNWLEFLRSETSPAPDAPDLAAADLVEHLLGQMSPADRWVIRLLDLEQKTVLEASQLTGWSRSGVKVRAFRARRRLRKLAEALGEV